MEAAKAITDRGQPAGLAAFGMARPHALAGHQPDRRQVPAYAKHRSLSIDSRVELPRIVRDISAYIASSTNPALTSVFAVRQPLIFPLNALKPADAWQRNSFAP
jgi:hypothetical protein